jgi:hypothetical protein
MRRQPQLFICLWLSGVVIVAQPAWGSANTPLSERASTSTHRQGLISQGINQSISNSCQWSAD